MDHHHVKHQRGLTDDQKNFINWIYGEEVTKPSLIMKAFHNANQEIPLKSKVVNFLVHHREKLHGKNQISLDEMLKWCQDHFNRPDDVDKGFVLNYIVQPGEPEFFASLLPLIDF